MGEGMHEALRCIYAQNSFWHTQNSIDYGLHPLLKLNLSHQKKHERGYTSIIRKIEFKDLE